MEFPVHFYNSLLLLSNVITHETIPDNLFRNIALTLQPMVRFDRLSLSIYDSETHDLTWFARAEGLTITCMDDADAPLRGPLAEQAIRTHKTYLVPDLNKLKRFKAIKQMLDAGLRWSIALPLMNRSQPLGALCFSFIRPMEEEDKKFIDFLEKISVQVALAVDNMLVHIKLQEMNNSLKRQVSDLLYPEKSHYVEERFFYQCDAMRRVVEQAKLIAQSNIPVLICGETGTGKEFIARFIHNHSPRRNHNFVKVNCPSLSSSLFESELFGHAKGAFTGAIAQRIGRFELADNGSIFLDEIGELDKMLQAKLLQVLQDSCFERVGESKPIKVDTRIISATNAHLEELIRAKEFRQDLYYRLGATIITLPPLRERRGELAGLLQHVLGILTAETQQPPITFSLAAWKLLEDYNWPGNLREFTNMVKRLSVLNPGGEISSEMLLPLLQPDTKPAAIAASAEPLQQASAPSRSGTDFALSNAEKELIEKVLTMTNGVVSGQKGAAALLKLPRSTLLYKMRKHGIDPTRYSVQH